MGRRAATRRRFLVSVLALAGAAGCASTPAVSNTNARFDFVAAPASAASAPSGTTAPPTVRVSQGRVEILGQLVTPDPCFDLSGAFTNANRELRVLVNATKRPGMCATVIETFAYRGTIADLPPGDYTLEVVHSAPNPSTPTTVVKQSIAVK
jgi:hypothetical protein